MARSIVVNNVDTKTECTNVAALAQELQLPERGVALAVNNKVLPRAEWESTELSEGDQITIIKAAFGG